MKKNKQNKVKILEYVFMGGALALLLAGFMLSVIGSWSFSKYYVEPIDIHNFYETFAEFLSITIKYSPIFYLGFLIIGISIILFLFALMVFVVDYEYYTKKPKELGIMLTKINPNKSRVESVEVGATYVDYDLVEPNENEQLMD